MSKPRVFVTREIPAAGLDKIRAVCDTAVWDGHLPPPRAELLNRVAGCQGILSLLTDKIDAELLDAAGPQLKVVSNYAVGYNNVDIAEATRRGIRVGNTPGVLTEATADCAFALLIAAARHIVTGQQYILAGKWQTWEPLGHIGLDLVGKTVGVVGLGRIGTAFARRCRFGWNMRVLYTGRKPQPAAEQELGARRCEFDELLAESDFVSVHADLNPSTQGMFNAAAFQKMKRTAVFINTARGPLHNQTDLRDALERKVIYAAGLDVTDPEPPHPADPLLRLPNLVIAPHVGSATVATRNGMAEIAADNLLAGLAGRPLRHCVNP